MEIPHDVRLHGVQSQSFEALEAVTPERGRDAGVVNGAGHDLNGFAILDKSIVLNGKRGGGCNGGGRKEEKAADVDHRLCCVRGGPGEGGVENEGQFDLDLEHTLLSCRSYGTGSTSKSSRVGSIVASSVSIFTFTL